MDSAASARQPWKTKEIIYLACVAPVMLAAFLEWFLWLAAFCYCLGKAYKKADHWSQRVLAVFLIAFFVSIRAIFLPVMIVTLPLPQRITSYLPRIFVSFLQNFAYYSFAILLTLPWLICVYRIVVYPLGRKKLINYALDEYTAPKVVVVMPVYKEPPDSLWTALNSVVGCDYPAACIHVFVSFDGEDIDELYLKTVDRLGIPVTIKEFPKSIDVAYNGARVTISRFRHGGKRHCQKATYLLIDKIYKRYLQRNDDMFILFIDSDCILDPVCIPNFMYEMQLKPGSKHDMLAMTGVITSCTDKTSLITLLQDMEYVHGQLYERSIESGCGAVTCLPGALTILRFSAFRNMAKFYFSDKAEHCEDLFDYGKTHLGEDRWLTHLFMLGARKKYQIQMCTSAFCKTEAVQTFRSLLKQRRRWFLGFITNEVCMLTDGRIWRKYPLLCIIRLMQNTVRTTALLLTVMLISVASTTNTFADLPWQFICVSLGLNWFMMLFFAFRLKRFKAVLYPLMFVLNPFLNWIYMVYGIFTAGQRTWGGPRADAGAADAKITPQEAIEHAIATGDDLNIVPETFKPALEARRRRVRPSGLQPSSIIEGRFSPTDHVAALNFEQLSSDMKDRHIGTKQQLRTWEDETPDISDSESISIYTPQRVEQSSGYFSATQQLDQRQGPQSPILSAQQNNDTERIVALDGAHTADPGELARRLSIIATTTLTYDGAYGSHDNRSPLGRTSPLTAQNLEMYGQINSEPVPEDGRLTNSRYATDRSSTSKRQKLRKEKPDPK